MCSSTAPQVTEIGSIPEVEDLPAPSPGTRRVVDAEPEDDLRLGPDREDTLHQVALGLRVVDDAPYVPVAVPECPKVEGGFVVSGGVEDGRNPGGGDAIHAGGEQVRVETHDVAVGLRYRLDQLRAQRPVQRHPLTGFPKGGRGRGDAQHPVKGEVVG